MKTVEQIRAHRNDLIKAMHMPCDCVGTEHALKCIIGGKMMGATAATLSWILGENDGMQEMVDRMAKDVREATASN